jgi:autotransporter-associated beta strand protein
VQSTNSTKPLVLASGSSNVISGDLAVANDFFYGKMIVQPGANLLINGNYMFGNGTSRTGEVAQTGGNVTVNTGVRVGHFGTEVSTLILSGGSLTIPTLPTGLVNPSTAAEVPGVFYVGIDGVGLVTQTGGILDVPSLVLDSRGSTTLAPYTNTYSLEGGRLVIGPQGIKSGSTDGVATYIINLGGGTVSASADWTSSRAMNISGTNGAVTFDPGAFGITLSGALTGPGGLIKAGAGILAINGTAMYTNTTIVNSGTLLVNGALGTNIPNASLTVNSGVLGGAGTVRSPLIVNSGATLTAGTNGSANTLTITNDITLNSGARLLFDLGSATTVGGGVNDLIAGKSNLTLNGTIPVAFNFLGGTPNTATPYTLMQYGGTLTGGAANLANSSQFNSVAPRKISRGLAMALRTCGTRASRTIGPTAPRWISLARATRCCSTTTAPTTCRSH